MKTTIEVKDRKEAKLIQRGLEDDSVRAFVKIMGALGALPTDRAKRRVMEFIIDKAEEGGSIKIEQVSRINS